MKLLRMTFLIFLGLLIGSAHAYAGSCFSEVIVFGDSNVDSGAESDYSLFNLTGGAIPGPPNVGGRSCNGPVVVEYAADMLDTRLVNFGVGGARTGETNLVHDFLPFWPAVQYSGVLSQLEWYADSLGKKKKADKKALYIYWAGSNDIYLPALDDLQQKIDEALENIETALTRLTDMGAKYILVATRTVRPDYSGEDNINGVVFNAQLRLRIQHLNQELKSEIQVFEAFDWITDMTYNPDMYGFIETTALCVDNDECIADPNVSDTYITWDAAHKTTRVHEIMAEALVIQTVHMRGNKGKCSVKHLK